MLLRIFTIWEDTARPVMNECMLCFPNCVCIDPPVDVYWYVHDMLLAMFPMTLTLMYAHDMLLDVIAMTLTLKYVHDMLRDCLC